MKMIYQKPQVEITEIETFSVLCESPVNSTLNPWEQEDDIIF